MVFSVGPSGVCWAVDKKETVLNHPLDIRFIKIRMVKDQLLNKRPQYNLFHQRSGVVLEQRTRASLAQSGSPSLAGVWTLFTCFCVIDHFPYTDLWYHWFSGLRPSPLARQGCGASHQRMRSTFLHIWSQSNMVAGDVSRWHFWPAWRCWRLRLDQGER